MADRFGPHDRKGGPRLEQIQRLGRGGLARQIVEDRGPLPFTDRRAAEALGFLEDLHRAPAAEKAEGVNKGGRPGLGKPWEAEGISRAAWFRRKKGGGG
jgi:hypothetical protein